jgi:divinyl chlorophyllide a 8-vinyl-reductase
MTDVSTAPSSSGRATRSHKRILVLGATGTIGRAAVRALLRRGHEVICFVRPLAAGNPVREDRIKSLSGAKLRFGSVGDPKSLSDHAFCGEHFDSLVSCLASRTGTPRDAWAIDYQAHMHALAAAKTAGTGLKYSIVRPTAFFKSLSGQVERVRKGKPFLLFGDGTRTACKPISDNDLAEYIADCVDNDSFHYRVLPIGGPGKAITPRQQGEALFALLGREPRFRRVPFALLDAIAFSLGTLERIIPALADKAELARIGRYYATESMLLLNPDTGLYDAEATPSTGTETLSDYYARLIRGELSAGRGEHAVF